MVHHALAHVSFKAEHEEFHQRGMLEGGGRLVLSVHFKEAPLRRHFVVKIRTAIKPQTLKPCGCLGFC